MTLKNFNVFGMIVFSETEATITATALDEKKKIERTFKFPIKARLHKEEAAMPFFAFVEEGKKPLVILRRRAIDLKGNDVKDEYIHTADIETALDKVLDLIEKAADMKQRPRLAALVN